MNEQITILTEETFGGYVQENDCMVTFFKSKCPNCKVLLKVMEKVKAKQPDIIMAAISSEEDEAVAKELDVSRVPTVIVYKGGEAKVRKTGIMKPPELEALYLGV